MGKTLGNIIFSVKEEISGFIVTDDTLYDDDYLIDKANTIRYTLIKEELQKEGIGSEYYQKICCLDVECHAQGCEIDGVFIPSGNAYSYVTLPGLINGVGEKNILYLGLDDMHCEFTRMSYTAFISSDGALWTNYKPLYTIIGNMAMVKNLPTEGLKKVCIVGILYNPMEACESLDDVDYPVPSPLKLEMLMKQSILSTLGIPGDEQHDTRDIKANLQTGGRNVQQQQQQQLAQEEPQ